MPPSSDELNSLRLKRREAILRGVAVFASFAAAAIMVFFVLRLVTGRMANERRVRESLESERQHFEAKMAPLRGRHDESSNTIRAAARGTTPGADIVDMSAGGPSRMPRSAAVPSEAPAVESPAPRLSQPPAGRASFKGIEHLEQKQSAIAELLRKFFSADKVQEILPLVRDAQRVQPLMADYYQRNRFKNRGWKGIGWSIPVEEPGYRFAYVQVNFMDSSPVNVVVEETDSGFLVDWESSVQYSEIGWKEFMTTKPVQPRVFRVLASKTDHGDGKATLSLKHPQEEGEVIAHFDPGDPRFSSLVEQLDLCKWNDAPVILRLCYPGPTTAPNEVQIAGVVGKGWLILDERSRGS